MRHVYFSEPKAGAHTVETTDNGLFLRSLFDDGFYVRICTGEILDVVMDVCTGIG